MDQQFEFKKKYKIFLSILIGIGVFTLVLSILILPSNRVWANVLQNNIYYLAFALVGYLFISVHIVGQAGCLMPGALKSPVFGPHMGKVTGTFSRFIGSYYLMGVSER